MSADREQVIGPVDRPHPTEQHGDAHRHGDPGASPREVRPLARERLVRFEDARHQDPSNTARITAMIAITPMPMESTSGMRDGTERLAAAHRPLVGLPVGVAREGDDCTERDEREAEQPAAERDVELRQQLRRGDAGGDQRERGAVPGEERPLVRVAEADVDLLLEARIRGVERLGLFRAGRGVGHAYQS